MFVSVILDPGGIDSSQRLSAVLAQYGFQKVQRACWESPVVSETVLAALKRDIDRVTDYYDCVRIYQFPVQNVLAVTELNRKKWKKILLRPSGGGQNP